jgi:hypothetical protein
VPISHYSSTSGQHASGHGGNQQLAPPPHHPLPIVIFFLTITAVLHFLQCHRQLHPPREREHRPAAKGGCTSGESTGCSTDSSLLLLCVYCVAALAVRRGSPAFMLSPPSLPWLDVRGEERRSASSSLSWLSFWPAWLRPSPPPPMAKQQQPHPLLSPPPCSFLQPPAISSARKRQV